MERSGIRDDLSHETPHSALLHAGYNIKRPRAKIDLLEIWDYIADDSEA